jgi:hypothetical protein
MKYAGLFVYAVFLSLLVPSVTYAQKPDRSFGTVRTDTLRFADGTWQVTSLSGDSLSMWVNAKTQFGAKGDGTTNDGPAIQLAIDSVYARGGGTVYLPAGRYLYSSRYEGGDYRWAISLKPGVTLRGEPGSTTITKDTVFGYMIDAVIPDSSDSMTTFFSIRDLILDCPSDGRRSGITPGTQWDGGIFLGPNADLLHPNDHMAKVVIDNVTVKGSNKEAIAVWGADYVSITNCRVQNCNFDAYNTLNVRNLFLANNWADSVYRGAELAIGRTYDLDTLSSAIVTGNIFTNVDEAGMFINGGTNFSIIGNTLTGMDTAIYTALHSGILVRPYITFGSIRTLTIAQNTISRFGEHGVNINNEVAGVDTFICGVTITNNVIHDIAVCGIFMNTANGKISPHTKISGNSISNWNASNPGNAYVFSAISLINIDSASITDNTIWNDLTASNRNDPLYLMTCKDITFSGNNCLSRLRNQDIYVQSFSSTVKAYQNNGLPYIRQDGVFVKQKSGPGEYSIVSADTIIAPNILIKANIRGPELISNGDFSDGDTGWYISSGGAAFSVISNAMHYTGDAYYDYFLQGISQLSPTDYYELQFTISNSTDSVGLEFVEHLYGTGTILYTFVPYRFYTNGTYSFKFYGSSSDTLEIWTHDDTSATRSACDIDNITLKQVGVGTQGDMIYYDTTAGQWTNFSVRGSDAFTTTATTDTVTIVGASVNDYYFVTYTGSAAAHANDTSPRVQATATGFVVHRAGSGTSGLTYNWWRVR